jgi:membrane dipeptidase
VTQADVERAVERSTAETAAACGISHAAADLFLGADVIDLHIESFSFTRALGYDLRKRHSPGLNQALFARQADLPRLLELGLRGGLFSLTANPWLSAERNLAHLPGLYLRLKTELETGSRVKFVETLSGYQRARRDGKLAAFLALQGATLLGGDGFALGATELPIVAVGLLHLTRTRYGRPSAPSMGKNLPAGGLTQAGVGLVEQLGRRKIFVDLAHLHPSGFWQAMREAPKDTPFIVTHTGVSGVHPHWRNLDDAMLRAVADRGGVVGIIYHSYYLGDRLFSGQLDTLVAHFTHASKIIGKHRLALGSDWDGLICTPRDMKTCLELPRLVEKFLKSGFSETDIVGILGGNFLSALEGVRGAA